MGRGIDQVHSGALGEAHVVSFGIDDQDGVASVNPSFGQQASQVAFPLSGVAGDQNAALGTRHEYRAAIVAGPDLQPSPARAQPLPAC